MFWITFLVGVVAVSLALSLYHFLPFLFKYGTVPKGSFGWPFLGETLSFLTPHPSTSTGAFVQSHFSRYGKVFASHLFMSPTIVSCDEELNYFILQNEGRLFQCSYPKPIHGILGESSMLVAVGETHRRLRSMALALVTAMKTKIEFLNDIERSACLILDSWKDERQVVFCEEARKYSFNVMVKQVLGLTPEAPQTGEILGNFLTFMKGLISLPINIPWTPYSRAVQARHRISSTVKAVIEERRKGGGRTKATNDDFLETLMSADILSKEEKVSFVLDSLLGGYETTSLLLAIAVFFLGRSTASFDQLKIEHENIRRVKRADEFLSWEDYRLMEFTQCVINEALRYGNVVKFVHRKALKDVKFRDYTIPSGWKVLPLFSAVHLDPSLHPDPHHFNPWRWKTQDQVCKKFTPFGGGSRCCPGFELAKVEVAFFLHHLVLKYRWEVEDDEQPMAYPYVEFKRGLKLHIL